MNTLRDVAQKALDAWDKWDGGTMDHAISPAIEVLRTALAEPQQEPVAWGYRLPEDGRIIDCITPEEHAREPGQYTVPLYAAPQPKAEPWTPRELELIDGMIEVQLHHADQCDRIANRTMAEKQKGWDMERVALLRKIRDTAPQPKAGQQESVFWEYKHVTDADTDWQRLVPRSGQTLETALAEIQSYRIGTRQMYEVRPLYTAPQPRSEPLTDADINLLRLKSRDAFDFARAIEAAHGIKGETK
jgi:hypothetical protein